MKKALWFGFMMLAGSAWAAEPVAAAAATAASPSANLYYSLSVVSAAFGLAIAAFGGAIGQGWSVSKAVEGIARQPEAANSIRGSLLLGLALIESLVIYALVVSMILIFVNPFAAMVVK
jgi:F-type H+-transporting ATPase subunit c